MCANEKKNSTAPDSVHTHHAHIQKKCLTHTIHTSSHIKSTKPTHTHTHALIHIHHINAIT